MGLLIRITVIWILFGVIIGLVLRRQLGPQRLGLVYSLSLLPWLGHLAYVIFYTLGHSSTLGTQLVILSVSSAVLALVGFWSGRRFAWTQPARLALVPVGIALLYAVPLIWFSMALRAQSIGMNSIPAAILVGATLFISSILGIFTFGLQPQALSYSGVLKRRD